MNGKGNGNGNGNGDNGVQMPRQPSPTIPKVTALSMLGSAEGSTGLFDGEGAAFNQPKRQRVE